MKMMIMECYKVGKDTIGMLLKMMGKLVVWRGSKSCYYWEIDVCDGGNDDVVICVVELK